MQYWLMKSEPDEFGIDDLASSPRKTAHWDGVRNYQARNMMRNEMKKGDQAFFYHSNTKVPGIAGVMEVAREGYVDHTAFDPDDPHYDAKSDPDKPRWFMVDVRFLRCTKRVIALTELREYADGALADFRLLARGNRLSIMPVSEQEWSFILSLE
ncbi:MAG: EVE domain-containing protein [Pseudomonadota bacterium]